MRKHTIREGDLLARLREETFRETSEPQMQISPDQEAFVPLVGKLIGAIRTIEIGVFPGYSSLSVCTALALPANGKIIACDVNETYTAIAKRYWKEADVDHKIDLRLAPAVEMQTRLSQKGTRGRSTLSLSMPTRKPRHLL